MAKDRIRYLTDVIPREFCYHKCRVGNPLPDRVNHVINLISAKPSISFPSIQTKIRWTLRRSIKLDARHLAVETLDCRDVARKQAFLRMKFSKPPDTFQA